MAVFKSSDVKVLFGPYDVGTSMQRFELALAADALDRTVFGDAAERVSPGQRRDTVTMGGLFDDATASDAAGSALMSTVGVVSIAFGTKGSYGYSGSGLGVASKAGGRSGELVGQELGVEVDSTLERCRVLEFKISLVGSSGSNGGGLDDGATTTAGGRYYIHAHTYAGTSTGTTSVLQYTATAWANVATFNFTGPSSTMLSSTGTLTGSLMLNYYNGDGGTAGTALLSAFYRRL